MRINNGSDFHLLHSRRWRERRLYKKLSEGWFDRWVHDAGIRRDHFLRRMDDRRLPRAIPRPGERNSSMVR